MEARRESLISVKHCRFCLSQDGLCSLFGNKGTPKKSITLALKILSSISIEVMPSDKMPTYICNRCKFFMETCYDYKYICREADEAILRHIQNGTALEPIVWPQSLVKLFRHGAKPSAKGVVKTVVEGGTTVEVTSQDGSDSEDGEEDIYNVKIEDGSSEGTSAFVKVVTSEAKDKKKKEPEEEVVVKKDVTAPAGCWACDECDCTYPLQQLLELHKMQRHKPPTNECDQCDAKFTSKYNLSVHQSHHKPIPGPFVCEACAARFTRPSHLRRHERVVHSELLQYKCLSCPALFISREQIQNHKERYHQPITRAFSCDKCDKKFRERSSLQRHKETVHETEPNLFCEYCPERFSSVAKLARHVRSHAGDRPYPCKYCDKSFTKSHHYTRHVRVKHAEVRMGGAGAAGGEYQCEQCSESFGSQDDLIYHSAIHATQNLTCPLCQEKFDDVDAVTTHIKSHVNGMEFMCDLCELVFTSKDKLDLHLITAHEDELHQQELTNDESSMDMDEDNEFENDAIKIKQDGYDMVVEINKPDEFMIRNDELGFEDRANNTNSEESEPEPIRDFPPRIQRQSPFKAVVKTTASPMAAKSIAPPASAITLSPMPAVEIKEEYPQMPQMSNKPAATFRAIQKVEELKRKSQVGPVESAAVPVKREKKIENSGGASDKSLRLLEKELQELQRTNTRNEAAKTPAKPIESARNRRPQIHTSTPKLRSNDDRKSQSSAKSTPVEKKVPERRGVKENKKPEESKEKINVTIKEEKDSKSKEEREAKTVVKEDIKEKSVVKNGSNNNKSNSEDSVRRSSRPSKVKDYAKMIRDNRSESSSDKDDETDDDDEEYSSKDLEKEKSLEASNKSSVRPAARRVVTKPQAAKQAPAKPAAPAAPAAAPAPAPTVPRKRGRPRKVPSQDVPAKVKKDESEEDESKNESKTDDKTDSEDNKPEEKPQEEKNTNEKQEDNQNVENPPVLVAPTGQTLKKVPMKALPPGIKPLPLPANARPELCEMQIGKKVVKVQKIVMTKAEVEAMAKKGLVEMKDGTMVLKQGIKIPTSDAYAIKSSLVGEESPKKVAKAVPTRCDIGDA